MEEKNENIIEKEVKETKDADDDNDSEKKRERKLVVPGEIIVKGEDYLPGDFTRKEEGNILANRYGLAEIKDRLVKIIPLSGIFEPRRHNTVIGIVEDITYNGWIVNIGGPYSGFLSLNECPRFINRNSLEEFAGVGDTFNLKVWSVKKGSVDLSLKSRGLGKLEGRRIIKINPHKVPKIIGKEGSMINIIKEHTGVEITVGQNGRVWLKGDLDGERKAEEAITIIENESFSEGLTEKVEKFLGGKK